jgi:hypothetical protein
MLTLIGQVKQALTASTSSALGNALTNNNNNDIKQQPIGTIKDITRTNNATHYELLVYLGDDLKDGQIKLDVSAYLLNLQVNKKIWDKYGDTNLEIKRQIKIPTNLQVQLAEHELDAKIASLIIRIPF